MKTLAIIPLRSGSKRLPNKNVMLMDGRPLFCHILDAAREVENIDDIVISTDSDMYRDMCAMYGAKVIMRSEEASTDLASSELVVLDVLGKVEEEYDLIVLLQATSPLTDSENINEAVEVLKSSPDLNSVSGGYEFRGFFTDDRDILTRPRSQDKRPRYIESGGFWVFRKDKFLEEKNRIIYPLCHVNVSAMSALEIDTLEDFQLIEYFLRRKTRVANGKYFKPRAAAANDNRIDPDGNVRDTINEVTQKREDVKDEVEFLNKMAFDGAKVLDIGCGEGLVSSFLSDTYTKYGIDPSPSRIRTAEKFIPKDKLICGEFKKGIYDKGSFHAAICYSVIEHVEDPVSFVEAAHDLLTQKGVLVLSTDNFGSPAAQLFGDKFRLCADGGHISLFTEEGLRNLVEDVGFYVMGVEFPFFRTRHFTGDNLLRLLDTSKISPPFYGSKMTFYCIKR